MTVLKGVIQNGQVVLSKPVDLPDGTPVTISPRDNCLGIPDDEWPTDPEGLRQLLARVERLEPFEMTPEEEAEVEVWRQRTKAYTIANQDKAIEGLFE